MGDLIEAKITVSFHGKVAIVCATGELDLSSCSKLREVFRSLGEGRREVVFNLGKASYLDTEVLTVIDRYSRDVIGRGGKVAMVVCGDIPKKVFSLTRMDKHYPVSPDLETAVQYVTSSN